MEFTRLTSPGTDGETRRNTNILNADRHDAMQYLQTLSPEVRHRATDCPNETK